MFFRDLVARGRSGVGSVTSDAHQAAPPPPSPSGEASGSARRLQSRRSITSPRLDASPVSHPISRERVRDTPASVNRRSRRTMGAKGGVEERSRRDQHEQPDEHTEYTPNTIRVTSTYRALVGVVVISSR